MKHLGVFLSYVVLSAAWSWPTCLLSSDTLVTRQFDLYPAIWLVDRAPEAFPGLYTQLSAWPIGESLTRADSFVLVLIGWVVQGVLPARVVCALVAWLGPAISALAAERCAGDGFGVPRPWSWLAGVVYGFSGVAATACLEGHVYQLLAPGLPLLWWAWARARTWRGGLLVGLAFAFALYSTAYQGVLALVLIVGLSLADPRRALRLAVGTALVALPAGLWYVRIYGQAGGFGDGELIDPARILVDGTIPVSALAGWSTGMDIAGHSMATPVGWMGFWLLLFAPVALRGEAGWRVPAVLALLALGFALGRLPRWDLGAAGMDLGLDALARMPGLTLFRFPVRGMALYALVAGVVGARVLARAGEVVPRFAAAALGLAVLDAVVGTGLPWRLGAPPAAIPSAYDAAPEGLAVLDLYGRPADRSGGEMELWARALSCYYQTGHRRPILEVCLGTGVESPRELTDRWLARQLLGGDVAATAAGDLGALGVGAVAVHADFYRPGDLAALETALEQLLGPPVAESADGGERVVLYAVPSGPAGTMETAWRRVRAGGS